ncbi:MarR family winged helix-turn-helix transcriptional regulator [Jutongia sp.]
MKDYLSKAEDFQRYLEQASELVCKKYGITITGLQILNFLGNHPDRNTAKDICSFRFIKNSIASMTIDKLVTRGYIVRECDAKDRRVQRLKLTGKAEPILEDGRRLRQQFNELIFEDFSEEEIEQFLAMLDRICESVRRRVERDNEQREEKGE